MLQSESFPPPVLVLWHTPTLAASTAERLLPVLSEAERRRYHQIRAPRRQREYLAGHFLVRQALCCLAPDWQLSHRLDLDDQQHLRLTGPPTPALEVNLSHSGEWVACVAAANVRVGVDIEMPRRPRNCLQLAAEYFAKSEFQRLQSLPAAERSAEFYRLWTLKESHLKARRSGLSAAELAREFVADEAGSAGPLSDWFSYSFNLPSAGSGLEPDQAPPLFGAVTLSTPLSAPLAVLALTPGEDGESRFSTVTTLQPRAWRSR